MNGTICINNEECRVGFYEVADSEHCCKRCFTVHPAINTYMRCKEIVNVSFSGHLLRGQHFDILPYDKDSPTFGRMTPEGWIPDNDYTSRQRLSIRYPYQPLGYTDYPTGSLILLCDGTEKNITIPPVRDIGDGYVSENIFFEDRLYIGHDGTAYFGS